MVNSLKAFGVAMIKLICGTIVFFSFVFTVFAVGPSLETKYFPVVTKLKILSMEPYGPNGDQTLVRPAFSKVRDCEYIGMAWYVGTKSDGFQRVSMILKRDEADTSSPNRPVGYQEAGPWIIGMSVEELQRKSFAQLVHRCHPFWMTTTDFYP